jgi:hypothetical protein
MAVCTVVRESLWGEGFRGTLPAPPLEFLKTHWELIAAECSGVRTLNTVTQPPAGSSEAGPVSQ